MKATHNEKKLSLVQFIWLGFNYTVGITFISNLAVLSNFYTKDKDGNMTWNPDSVGMNIIWIFILLGLVASVCAFAFAKLSRIHKSDNNGGSYLYARTSFGRFTGFITTFMQYICLPFLIAFQIFNLLKTYFSVAYTGGGTGMELENYGWFKDHQQWVPLFLDVIGILVYFFFAFVVFGGMKLFKKLSNITGIIKWVTAGFLIVAALVIACQPGNSSNYSHWFNSDWTKNFVDGEGVHHTDTFKLSFGAFSKAFTSCFFFYAGFEVFATAGKNIENPEKNVGLGILLILLISTVFYVLMILLFIGSVDPQDAGFTQNMQIHLWSLSPFSSGKDIKWFGTAGMILMVFSQISLKANVSMQNALYGGSMLQPLAQEGYISENYGELNRDDLPLKGSKLNFLITGVVILIWLILPDIYQGISNAPAIFNISQLTEASSAITLMVYAIVISCVLLLSIKKVIKVSPLEWIVNSIVLVLLVALFFNHYYELFAKLFSNTASSSDKVGSALELIFIIGSGVFGTIWYFTYYRPRLIKRFLTPKGIKKQAELDFEFTIVNPSLFTTKFLFSKKGLDEKLAELDKKSIITVSDIEERLKSNLPKKLDAWREKWIKSEEKLQSKLNGKEAILREELQTYKSIASRSENLDKYQNNLKNQKQLLDNKLSKVEDKLGNLASKYPDGVGRYYESKHYDLVRRKEILEYKIDIVKNNLKSNLTLKELNVEHKLEKINKIRSSQLVLINN